MDKQQTDKLINDFLFATDEANKLESEINLFAEETAPALLKTYSLLRPFRDAVYSFNMSKHNVNGKIVYDVKVLNLTAWRNTMDTEFEQSVHKFRASFEFDPNYSELEQVKQSIALLFFRIFDLVAKPEVSDDGVIR